MNVTFILVDTSPLQVTVGKTTASLLQKIDSRVAVTRRGRADRQRGPTLQTNHSTPDTSKRPTGVLLRMTEKEIRDYTKSCCLSDKSRRLHDGLLPCGKRNASSASAVLVWKQSPEQPGDTAAKGAAVSQCVLLNAPCAGSAPTTGRRAFAPPKGRSSNSGQCPSAAPAGAIARCNKLLLLVHHP